MSRCPHAPGASAAQGCPQTAHMSWARRPERGALPPCGRQGGGSAAAGLSERLAPAPAIEGWREEQQRRMLATLCAANGLAPQVGRLPRPPLCENLQHALDAAIKAGNPRPGVPAGGSAQNLCRRPRCACSGAPAVYAMPAVPWIAGRQQSRAAQAHTSPLWCAQGSCAPPAHGGSCPSSLGVLGRAATC